MNPNKTQHYASLFKAFSTQRLEGLLPALLKELRHRDSKHMKADAISNTHNLRSLRSTGKLS